MKTKMFITFLNNFEKHKTLIAKMIENWEAI